MWRAALDEASQELNRRFPDKAELANHVCIQAARDAYTAYGVNPKRYPPASEALAKRVLGGKPLPAINTMVDFNNLLSLQMLLPVGSYNRAEIKGAVTFQRGAPGQSYTAIGGDPFSAEGFPTFFDEVGPFGGTTRDSLRTLVKPGVTEVVTLVMSFVDPRAHNFDGVIRQQVQRAEALGLGKVQSFTWIS
jgi:DNA/RNA-binding domain of Phe-tRNA-synthetase-like protein